MKKQLLSLACAAALLPAFNASAEPALMEVWKYQSTELNDGWDGTAPNWANPSAIKSKPCPRFATAKDGKIYTVNMKTMSIAEITPDGMVDRYTLPSLAGVEVDGIADYYGTSITRDDAGNFIVGHLFTKAPQSAIRWTVYEPATGKYKHFTLNVPDGMTIKRADCVGRAIGDVTRNGFLYLAPDAFVSEGTHLTNQKVRILHFTGDGDVDNIALEDSWSPMVYLASKGSWNNIAQPKYATITEALANPVNSGFYTSSAWYSSTTYKPAATYFGFTATGAEDWGLTSFGATYNAGTNGFDTFVLDGQRYYVRNNIEGECKGANANTMNIAVYDASFNKIAVWENAEYWSNLGYSSIVAEPIDNETAYICVYNSTGNLCPEFDADGIQTNTKVGGGAAAVLKFTTAAAPAGSEENPYKIATAADLCDMHNKIVDGQKVWFVLENDIDMAGVTDYIPAIGSDGATYFGEFEFDGQNHVIKNFAPEAKYSYMSIFGVIRGNVKNLGIEDCNIVSNSLGAGALGGYGSQGGIDCVIDNVWATGSVKCNGAYAGGLVGTNGNNLTITNSYFNGTVEGVYAGGLVGRGRAGITIKNSYAAGTVTATSTAGGIAGTDKGSALAIALENVIAWNASVAAPAADAVTVLSHDDATGVEVWEGMKVNDVAVEGGKSAIDLQVASADWTAYKNLINGYPALAWQEATEEVPFPGCEINPYKIATAADLNGLAAAVNKDGFYVEFTADIDMDGVAFAPIDAKKVLYVDGKGHVVRNLSVEAAKAAMFLDFKGTIKNLGMENASMTATGWGTAGCFIAYALNEAVIENCYATGSVTGFYAGGLAAGVQSAGKLTVRNCYSAVNATSTNGWAGGLVGPTNENGTLVVENCYASGRIDGFANGGGVVAGANTNYANPCNVTLTNVVAWNSEVVKGAAIVPASTYLNAVVTEALVWDGMTVNGAAVEEGKSTYELQVVVTGWEAFNDKLKDGMPVLAWQEATEEVVDPNPLGSETNPYKIATAADLCDMHNKIVDGQKVWFVLENDIDMAGVTDYIPAIGSDGATYFGEFEFDGQNHVIKNFAPEANYSYMSIFGVIRGNVKNLGIEDCNIVSNSLGAGALGGYGSQGGIDCVIDNVWATGSVKCNGAYAGGLVGTNGDNLTITNSYFNGTVEGKYAGGLVGRGRVGITIKNCYAAGAVTATDNAGGIAGTDKTNTVAIALENVVAWNTAVTAPAADAVTILGHADATGVEVWEGMKVNDVAVEGGKSTYDLQVLVTGWEAYNDKLKNGMPVLAWQEADEEVSAVSAVEIENADAAPEYYNLQGVRVENPTTGLYIVKRGNKVTKEIIR